MDVTTVQQHAPFLAEYGPIFVSLILGVLIAKLWDYRCSNNRENKTTSMEYPSQNGRFVAKARVELVGPSQPEETNEHASHAEEHALSPSHIPLRITHYSPQEMRERSRRLYQELNQRRSVRMFSNKVVPHEVIENIIRTAGTSPSGGHKEPWTYAVVSSPSLKDDIRHIIEEEERINYERRMSDTWVKDCQDILNMEQMKAAWEKPYLSEAPYLVIVFKQVYGLGPGDTKITHYYTEISTAISVGLMLAAIQNAGLVTVTSTPMNSGPRLRQLLNRPMNEKVVLLLPVGFPKEGATVPDLRRKPLEDIMVTYPD